MKNKSFQILTSFFICGAIMVSLCSSNFLLIWGSLEISVIGFLVFSALSKNYQKAQALTQYFIVQSLGSSMFIWSFFISLFLQNNSFIYVMLNLCFLLKLGMPPFHSWMVLISQNLNWESLLMLLTFLKIIPMVALHYMSSEVLWGFSVFGSVLSSFSIIYILSMKKMMTFSSIFNLSWMLSSVEFLEFILVYMLIYIFSSSALIFLFSSKNLNHVNSLKYKQFSSQEGLIMSLVLFNLAGIPPMGGFFIKLSVLKVLVASSMFVLIFSLIISSILMFFMYFRLMVFFFSKKTSFFMNSHQSFIFMNLFSSMSIIMSSLWGMLYKCWIFEIQKLIKFKYMYMYMYTYKYMNMDMHMLK